MSNDDKIIKMLEEQNKILSRIEKLLVPEKTQEKSKTVVNKMTKQGKMTVPVLLMLLKENNFFNEPQTIGDISKKLQEESRNVPVTSLTLPLQRLVRSRQLGRILQNGKWSYIKRD